MTTLQPSYVKTADVLKSRMNLGEPFRIGRDNCRRIENPSAAGLKLAGYADELARRTVDHNGWYLDDDGSDDLARGIVFQLPHRRGYVYGAVLWRKSLFGKFAAELGDAQVSESCSSPISLGRRRCRE